MRMARQCESMDPLLFRITQRSIDFRLRRRLGRNDDDDDDQDDDDDHDDDEALVRKLGNPTLQVSASCLDAEHIIGCVL